MYQDELEGTGHVSDTDAGTNAATLEDLDCYVCSSLSTSCCDYATWESEVNSQGSYGNLPDMSTTIPCLILVCMKWNWEMEQLLRLQQMSLLSPCMHNVMLRETAILRETVCVNGCNCGPSYCLDESVVKDADKLLL